MTFEMANLLDIHFQVIVVYRKEFKEQNLGDAKKWNVTVRLKDRNLKILIMSWKFTDVSNSDHIHLVKHN